MPSKKTTKKIPEKQEPSSADAEAPVAVPEPWQVENLSRYPLEIHHISVSIGDATVIAVRGADLSTATPKMLILIDAGSTATDLAVILAYCKQVFETQTFNKVIVSHMHDDHHGALPVSTVFESGETELIIGSSIDASPFDGDDLFGTNDVKITQIQAGLAEEPYRIDLMEGATLTCYCNGGMPMTGNPLSIEKYKTYFCGDENDFSLAWLLEYGDFRYFTAGDLSGANTAKYKNIEGELIRFMTEEGPLKDDKKVQVLKVTHHGSKYSSYGSSEYPLATSSSSPFLEKLAPRTVIIPCNNSITPPLPTPEFFRRISNLATIKDVVLVNSFYRYNILKYDTKYLNLHADCRWHPEFKDLVPDTTNLILLKDKDENTYYSNLGKSNKLPVCTVCVNASMAKEGDYLLDWKGRWVNLEYLEPCVNISKKASASVPQRIHAAFFETKIDSDKYGSGLSLFQYILQSSEMKEVQHLAPKIESLYYIPKNESKDKGYKFDSGSSEALGLIHYKKFIKKYDFIEFLKHSIAEKDTVKDRKLIHGATLHYLQQMRVWQEQEANLKAQATELEPQDLEMKSQDTEQEPQDTEMHSESLPFIFSPPQSQSLSSASTRSQHFNSYKKRERTVPETFEEIVALEERPARKRKTIKKDDQKNR